MKQEFGKIRLSVDVSVWRSIRILENSVLLSVRNYLAKSVVGYGGFSVARSVANSVHDSVRRSIRNHLEKQDF